MPSKFNVKDTETHRTFTHEIFGEQVRIGRAEDRNDLVLDDTQVSREHAVIRRVRGAWMIVDLRSANGTWVNGRRVEERVLADGDSVSICKYTLEYKTEAEAAAIAFDDGRIGNTVFVRAPSELTSVMRKQEAAAIAAAGSDSKTVFDHMEALRKKAETLARIYELNKLLSADFSIDAIFRKVSDTVFRLTPADRFLVLLKEAGSGALVTASTEFRSKEQARAAGAITISRTVVDRVMSERVSLLSLDAMTDARLTEAKSIMLQNIRSVMCAPLLSKDAVLGVIYVDSRERFKQLKEDDLDLLNAVAAVTSIAVDNATTHGRLVREELARAKYRRFMPPHVVDEILADPEAINLGGTNTDVTMLFSDVRGFTSMSERLMPQVVVQILNEYFADMTPIVFEHGGLLDKYMGDGLMALFGVPYERPEAAADAVAAAVDMQRRMGSVNRDLEALGMSEIAIGIGIHTGPVTVGYIGSEERTDYTAIGDAVNLAARLEKQAHKGQIIISRSTCEALDGRFPVRAAGEILVKGKTFPVQIYEVLWRENA